MALALLEDVFDVLLSLPPTSACSSTTTAGSFPTPPTLTADPLHCQKETARIIAAENGGDYFLQINGNQPTLLELARRQTGACSALLSKAHCGHGRVEERALSLCAAEPMATGFPYSRAIVRIHSKRTEKKRGKESVEDRYNLSSQPTGERTPEGWIYLSRSHWASVENRNHWRRDASLGEDATRLHHGKALINLALLRSAGLRLSAMDGSDDWLPAKKERLAAHPALALALFLAKL